MAAEGPKVKENEDDELTNAAVRSPAGYFVTSPRSGTVSFKAAKSSNSEETQVAEAQTELDSSLVDEEREKKRPRLGKPS